MSVYLKTSKPIETRAFVKEIEVRPARPRSTTRSPFLNRHQKLQYSWAVDLDATG